MIPLRFFDLKRPANWRLLQASPNPPRGAPRPANDQQRPFACGDPAALPKVGRNVLVAPRKEGRDPHPHYITDRRPAQCEGIAAAAAIDRTTAIAAEWEKTLEIAVAHVPTNDRAMPMPHQSCCLINISARGTFIEG
jgi:hypothetical protein